YPKRTQGLLEDKTDYTLHSAAHLRVTDPKTGRSMGYNDEGGVDESMPGTFLDIDGVEYISIAGRDGTHQVLVKGTNDGKFTLNINLTRDGKKNSYVYPDVAVKQSTTAQVQINPSQSATILPDLVVNSEGKMTRVPAKQVSESPLSGT